MEYEWPVRRLVRPFLDGVSVEAAGWTIVARLQGEVCGVRRQIGLGGMIFLGAMIGPGLLGEEPEAHQVAAGLLKL